MYAIKKLRKGAICVGIWVTASAFASDSRISQSQRQRHEDMLIAFQRPCKTEKPEPYTNLPSLWDRAYMTGDWGGFRNTLADAGITIDLTYVTNLLDNVAGGKERGFAYTGSFGISTNIDFTQAGWTGFNLFNSFCWRTGTNLSNKIDNQFTVSQIFGSEIVRLNELYLLQNLIDKRLIFKAGRLDAGNDFLCSPLYWHYVNNAFDGNPVSIFYNIPFTAYPNATWGAFIEAKPWKRLSTKFAIYNANSEIQKNKHHGMDFTFSSTNGVVWITEWCALVNQEKSDRGMPGNYKAGFFYLTGDTEKFSGGTQRGDPGFYFLFDQTIYRPQGIPSGRGLTPFISLIFQPKNRNLMPFFANGGLVYQGPFESRPRDSASFGVIYGHYSRDRIAVQKQQELKPQKAETVLELNYWFQINKWFYIMPDMQYIIRPKGLDTPNAWVIGAQIGLDQW